METEELSQEIIDFVTKIRGKYKFKFNLSTTLEKDLKITGDEGWQFIEEFASEFKVDISNIDLFYYFAVENSLDMYGLLLFGIKTGKKELTLGHLEKAKRAKRLDEEIING